jgi:type III secretory pathway component EscV
LLLLLLTVLVAAILPWFTWLFSALACVLMMLTWMSASEKEVNRRGASEKNDVDVKDQAKEASV